MTVLDLDLELMTWGAALRAASSACRMPPAAAMWLSLMSTPSREIEAVVSAGRRRGPHLQNAQAGGGTACRQYGHLVPAASETAFAVIVATPDMRCIRFKPTRSPVRSCRAQGPVTAAITSPFLT